MPDAANQEMIYVKIPVGMLQCNCSIIGDPRTLECVVVDPGDEVERILGLLGRYKLKVKAIVSTHAHIDHVGGLAKLYQYTGAPVMMHRDDLPLYRGMEVQAAFLGVRPRNWWKCISCSRKAMCCSGATSWRTSFTLLAIRLAAFHCICPRMERTPP